MKERIIGAIILTVVLLPTVLIGGILFKVVVAAITCGAVYELIKTTTKKVPVGIYVLASVCALAIAYYSNTLSEIRVFEKLGLDGLLVAVCLLMLLPSLFLREKSYGANDAIKSLGAVAFLGVAFSSVQALYFDSIYQLLLVVFVAVTTDVFALFGGMLIGKHKLTKISPKKTIEGSAVGLVVCIIITTTYYMIAIKEMCMPVAIVAIALLSIAGQMGDLLFSLFKRENDIKDYSHLIPGHGGILDRFDSLIVITLVYTIILRFI